MMNLKSAALHDVVEMSPREEDRTQRAVDASQRRAEIVIAALFLITAAVSIPAAFLLDPILNASGYLAKVYPQRGAIEWAPCCGRSSSHARAGWIALYLDAVPVPTRATKYLRGWLDRLRPGVVRGHCRLVRSH